MKHILICFLDKKQNKNRVIYLKISESMCVGSKDEYQYTRYILSLLGFIFPQAPLSRKQSPLYMG